MARISRLFVFLAVLALPLSFPSASEEDAKKAQEEIQNAGRQWVVEFSRGTIQYRLLLKLNGANTGVLGQLSGEGVIRVKEKKVRIAVEMQLTNGKFHYITRYPAMTFTYVGKMVSSDPQAFPVREDVQLQDSLLLKEGRLCPLSIRQNPPCMVPGKN